jgi:hypothetical protein
VIVFAGQLIPQFMHGIVQMSIFLLILTDFIKAINQRLYI